MTHRRSLVRAELIALTFLLMLLPVAARGARRRRPEHDAPLAAPTIRLPGHVLPALADASPTSGVDGHAAEYRGPLTLTIVLNRDDQPGFERYLQALQNPRSPDYRHFLTQQQIADRFGPSRRAYDRVRQHLRAAGLDLVGGSPNRLTLTVRGSRADVERAFAVHIADYTLGGQVFYANDRDPALPRAVAPHVQAVVGLSNLARPRETTKFFAHLGQALKNYVDCVNNESSKSLTKPDEVDYPKCFRKLQSDLKLLFTDNGPPSNSDPAPGDWVTLDGAGQTVGLLEFDTFQPSDVSDFLTLIGAPASRIDNVSRVAVNGGATRGPGESEVLLDIDAILAIAPGAKVVVYDAPFSGANTSFQALFNAMINGGVTVISNSWAYCEDQTTLADVQSIDSILQNAAAAGISVFNGAGDSGSTCLDGAANTVAVPADSPHATAVGGSTQTLGPGLTRGPETWWDGSNATPPTGQGGFGVSRFFSRPGYQDGLTSAPNRSVPDVVAGADPAEGVMICQASAGGCPTGLLYGGTSNAAPVWAAFTAILNQGQGQNLGALNSRIYPLAGAGAFHDAAALGSDFAHVGLGSPNLNQLHLLLAGKTAGAPNAATSEVTFFATEDAPGDDATFIPADGTSEALIVVKLRDGATNIVSGKTVSLAASAGSHAVITPPSGVTTVDNGAVVFRVTDLTAETVTFTATDTTDGIVLGQVPSVPFGVPPAASAGITASPTTVTADGTSATTITVTLQDALHRPTPGKTIQLSQGGGHSIITGPGVTDASGQATFTATDQVNETVTYTAIDVSDGSLPVPGTAQVTFGGGSGSACAATLTPPAGLNGNLVTPWANGFVAENFNFGNVNWGGCPGASNPTFQAQSALVADFRNGQLFKFGLDGGAASGGNVLASLGQTLGQPTFGKDGSLYATFSATTGNFTTGNIVQLDPATGQIMRTVAQNLICPNGLSVDPLSGDLFFDDDCTGAGSDNASVFRVVDPTAASPSVVVYATLPTTPNGSLAFAPNGTLYAVVGYYNNPVAPVVRIAGTDQPSPPAMTPLAGVTTAFGVAVGETLPSGEAKSLLVVPNGVLTLVDITASPVTSTPLVQNLAVGTIGPDGCLYANGNTTIYKVTNVAGGCGFAPTNPGPQLSLSPQSLTPDPAQGTQQRFTATLRNVADPAHVPVFFAVTGTNPRVQMVQTDASGQAVLTYAAERPGADVVIAQATVGSDRLTSNQARVTWDAGKHVTFLTLNPSPTAGSAGQAVAVIASLTDASANPPLPVAGAGIAFAVGSAQCTAQTDARGLATCELSPTGAGTETMSATFAGTDSLLAASDAVGFTVVVQAAPTSTTTTLPPVGCTPSDCGDGDGCTTDVCDAGQCRHDPLPGFAGVTCYLDAIKSALTASAPPDVPRALRRKLLGRVKKLGRLVTASQHPGRRGTKAEKKLAHQLGSFTSQLQRLRGKKVAAQLDDTLVAFAHGAQAAMP